MKSLYKLKIYIVILLVCSCQIIQAKVKCQSYNEKILVRKGLVLGTTGLFNDKNPLHYRSSDFICTDNYMYLEYNFSCSSGAEVVFYDFE